MSKIPQAVFKKPLSPILETKEQSVKFTLKRRSKSYSDLRVLKDKNTFTFNEGPKKKTVAPTLINKKPTTSKPAARKSGPKTATSTARQPLKAAQKRPAAVTQKDDEAVKRMKVRKVPEWDYKTRFGILSEKHTILQAEHAKCLERFPELKKLQEQILQLTKEKRTLNKENETLNVRLEELEKISKDHENLKSQHTLLEKDHRNIKEQLKSISKQNKELSEQNYLLENNCKELDIEVKSLKGLVQDLRNQIYNYEVMRRDLHNTIQDLKGNIRVFCRVRPPVGDEEQNKLPCNIDFIDEQTIELKKSKQSIKGKLSDVKSEFQFDRVFSPESTQEQVFEELAQLVQSALDGYNVCVFAYGQTGSGKTFTMQGENSPKKLGMIPRTIALIFESIEKLKNAGWTYKVQAGFLEIYNETIVDLLDPTDKRTKEIRFNEGRGTTVTNLTIKDIEEAEQLLAYMRTAQTNRATGATDFNERSSRSHAVTRIYLEGSCKSERSLLTGSINLVDLAGSESAKTSCPGRLVETKNINKSLSSLGNVMLALHKKDQHVPYRNCKLTYLLQPCLGGNSKSLMFVNISPFEECYNESINSLRFAQTVKDVKMSVKRNKSCL